MKLRRFLSCMMALLLVCGLPLAAFADTYDLAEGSITVTAKEDGQYVTQENGVTDHLESTPTVITQTGSETATTNTVTITAEKGAAANVTLDGVNIDVGGTGGHIEDIGDKIGEAAVQITGNGDVTLELDGENTVQSGFNRAGVEKNTTAATDTEPANGTGKLTITDENGTSGSLEATGGESGSGIGGGRKGDGSNITISGSAEVTATGGFYGSGIGGGFHGDGSNITIEGSAEVTAKGGEDGSGIGGGFESTGSNITITGSAEVTANGGQNASGIGGGNHGDGSNITITGSAEVTAKGGNSGSGIGGGFESTGSDITVSGDAQVKAQGGNQYTVLGQNYHGAGAAIGNGGEYKYGAVPNPGDDVTPNTDDLNEGWIATYAPDTTDLDTATPKSLTYKGASNVTGAQPIVKLEPTCTEDGHRAGFTVNGNQVGGQTLPTTGHSMGEYYTAKEATCQEAGEERSDCENCNYYETRPLKKVDHSYGVFASDNNATCTSDGTKTRKCIWCGLEDTVPDPGTMKEHSFTNYISNNDATYDSDGTKTAKCDHCDATDTIPDPGSRLVPPRTALYRVIGQDDTTLTCQETRKDGVLTITAEEDYATLTGSLSGMKTLKAHGIDTIVFVTKDATSTFAVEDLLAQGASGDTYQLTHDGSTVTFTLNDSTDIRKILK